MSKYVDGTRVRVKAMARPRDPYSDIWQYENLPGEVVYSNLVTAQESPSCTVDSSRPPLQVLRDEYKVRLDIGVTVDHVDEECLEAL